MGISLGALKNDGWPIPEDSLEWSHIRAVVQNRDLKISCTVQLSFILLVCWY